MILTLAETKSYLNISDSSLDADITRLIPIVQKQVVSLTFNDFESDYAVDIFSIDDDTVTITVQTANLIEAADDVFIERTFLNNGHWAVASVSSNILTITNIKDEPMYGTSKLTLVQWPDHLKYIASQIVLWHTKTEADSGEEADIEGVLSSESLGDYRASYVDDKNSAGGTYNYPAWVAKDLQNYTHNVRVH